MEAAVKMERRDVLGVLGVAAGSVLLPGSLPAAAEQTPAPNDLPAERVTGIGGVFFRARDPKALAQWYRDHLGVTGQVWKQEAGATAFTPFAEKTTYFGDAMKQWMINFRVSDLDKMVRQLEAAGIEVKVDPATYPNVGRFARIHDPEGNPIELWQPMK
jgi:predicted enzyme related to lactoylglutathione lyase